MKIGKIILVLIMITSQLGCSQKLTLDLINTPSKKYFSKELKQQIETYKDFPDMVKDINDRENMYFNIRIENRNKALKDIDFESKKIIIIIDKLRSSYSGLVEDSFVFTDNDDVYTNIIQSADDEIVRIIKKKNLKLDNVDEDVLKVYQNFNSKDVESLNKDLKKQLDVISTPVFYVTVIKKGKVKYYTIDLETGYKVIER
ncbi:hypothetical protein J2X31_003132 [Flavobacterium arsenatis]|uniref:Lipoprotein n=1 Tax=Flavobacterium arsenatis TaxID=1484332 RepID=A0ABU1TT95_9FLAO|nr:hypothetical protein [Flavobacterium arsenatis]MDR6969106.1 hypothetical protein [Flavobacterium arsenatis]